MWCCSEARRPSLPGSHSGSAVTLWPGPAVHTRGEQAPPAIHQEKRMTRHALAVSLAALLAVAIVTPATANAPPRFPAGAVWNQDVRAAPLHPNSASMISTLASLGGFGYGRMQIDFGMHIVNAPAGSPMRSIVGYPTAGESYAPDCEVIGTQMPVPTSGAIEANTGLSCANASEDCHLLVVQGNTLYEAYRANASGA